MDDGGPAFPQQMLETDRGVFSVDAWGAGGMSLRDWFAGMALASAIAVNRQGGHIAEWAYGIADAMLLEGEKDRAVDAPAESKP